MSAVRLRATLVRGLERWELEHCADDLAGLAAMLPADHHWPPVPARDPAGVVVGVVWREPDGTPRWQSSAEREHGPSSPK